MLHDKVPTKPCLQDIPYDSTKDIDQLPTSPVLSILQFTFHPGVGILEPSQPVSTLWQASLQFLSTIPGFQGLHWAPVDETTQQIIILIQWDSGIAWRRFQCSIGFSMLLGYLAECYNGCVQLALPVDISNGDCLLELVSYQFPQMQLADRPKPSVTEDEKQSYKTKWESTFLPHVDSVAQESQLISACGNWLEKDEKDENRYFAGLLFWKADMPPDSPRQLLEANVHNIRDRIAELSKHTCAVVSSLTTLLRRESVDSLQSQETTILDYIQIKHPILSTPVKREYSQFEQDPATKTKKGSSNRWYPMGSICQHHMPRKPSFSQSSPIEMISFRAQSGNSRVESLFKDLRIKLWNLGGSPTLRWGSDRENAGWYTRMALLIDLKGIHAASKQIQFQFEQAIGEFSMECGDAIQNLTHTKIHGPGQLKNLRNIEITRFDIPADESDRASFEYAYSNYIQTMHPQIINGASLTDVPPARPQAHGWIDSHEDLVEKHQQQQTIQFTSTISWASEAARTAWYGEYTRRASSEYGSLGFGIPWLRILSRRVATQFLVLEEMDPEISAKEAEILRSKPVQRPVRGSMFTQW